MSDTKVYFITGANRGIGLSLVGALKNEGTIFATARKPAEATELNALAKEHKNIHVLKLDVDSKSSNLQAAEEVKKIVRHVDVLIANAGISQSTAPITSIGEDDLEKHFKTNTFGSIYTFQAIYPLLKEGSEKTAVFISSAVGSLNRFFPYLSGAYGPSKAALNHIVRQLDVELRESGFKIVALHPGLVSSDMGKSGIAKFKKNNVDFSTVHVLTPTESASQIHKTINGLDKTTGVEFLNYDGTSATW